MPKKLSYLGFEGYLKIHDSVAPLDTRCNYADFMVSLDSKPTQAQSSPAGVERTDPSSTTENKPDIPGPKNYPGADVLIYDGRCVFCAGQVRNLMRLDGKNRLAFVSLHDEFVANQFPDLGFDQMMKQMYLIPSAGPAGGYSSQRFGGAAAIRYLSRRLPKLWILAPLMHIPFSMPIWQWGYNLISKHRYKIAGMSQPQCDEDGTCELHFKD